MSVKNVRKGWKTSILGLFLVGIGSTYIFHNQNPDYVIMSILIAFGVGLIFAPDSVLTKLEELISKKSKEI